MQPQLGTQKVIVEITAAQEEEAASAIRKAEIECLRRRDSMELCPDLDKLYFVCD